MPGSVATGFGGPGGSGAADWKVFAATHWFEQRLGGIANIDQMDCPTEEFSGMSVRENLLAGA
jgi:hypothetical protein